jgi:phage-related protein
MPRSWAKGALRPRLCVVSAAMVMEIAAYDATGTYRAVYTVSIGESIYVIHAFQKKSKAGIATPKSEMQLIRQRLKQLKSEVKNAEK